MALSYCSLNSGSNGNCYYVGNETEALLIDAGISCRETERRMKKLGLNTRQLKAIFVTHEHSDHISGVPGLSKKFHLPVYITAATFRESHIPIEDNLLKPFEPEQTIRIGSLEVTAFPKFHDAVEPHSFIIAEQELHVGVFTDIGHACKNVIRYFRKCQAVFLESNYCVEMLAQSRYPASLKERISSDHGHLSNDQALELFLRHKGKQMQHLILSHLSQNNNTMKKVEDLFLNHAGNVQITIASRHRETELFHIRVAADQGRSRSRSRAEQLSLFQ
jgi:phosphoribosyl 1,2-cyclic phosphodiesterase